MHFLYSDVVDVLCILILVSLCIDYTLYLCLSFSLPFGWVTSALNKAHTRIYVCVCVCLCDEQYKDGAFGKASAQELKACQKVMPSCRDPLADCQFPELESIPEPGIRGLREAC